MMLRDDGLPRPPKGRPCPWQNYGAGSRLRAGAVAGQARRGTRSGGIASAAACAAPVLTRPAPSAGTPTGGAGRACCPASRLASYPGALGKVAEGERLAGFVSGPR